MGEKRRGVDEMGADGVGLDERIRFLPLHLFDKAEGYELERHFQVGRPILCIRHAISRESRRIHLREGADPPRARPLAAAVASLIHLFHHPLQPPPIAEPPDQAVANGYAHVPSPDGVPEVEAVHTRPPAQQPE